ncbi:hypothetical protein EV122DRAFT_263771 [Schizophyllum commune]
MGSSRSAVDPGASCIRLRAYVSAAAPSQARLSTRLYNMMPPPQPYPRAPTPSNDATSSRAPSPHEATLPPNPKLVFRLPNFAFTNVQPAAAPTSINLAPTKSASKSTSNAHAPTTSTSTRRSAKTRATAAIKSLSAKILSRPKPSRASSPTAASASSAAASYSRSTRSSTARSDSAESETTLVTPPRDATEPDDFHWEIEPLPGTVQRPYTLEQTDHWQKVKAYVAKILKSATGKQYKAVDLDPDEVVDRFLEERYERTGIKPTVRRSVAKTPAGKKTSARKGAKRARVVVEPESEDEEDDVEEAEEAEEEHMEADEQEEEDDDDEEYVQEVQQPAARAGTKRKRATTDDDDDDDEPANPAKDERTNHDIGERIELLRLDEMVIWFGAHHVLCAGCLRIIGTEARWDFYNGGLWHKHKYRNCKGFKRWEEKPPSKEDLMAWQKSRNRCADGLVSLLPSSMGRMMC